VEREQKLRLDYSRYKNGEIVKEIITLFTQNNLCLLEALDVLDSAKDALNFAVISDFSA
jgi:hypothetical protein